jgi:hypothetical protein
MIAGVIPILIGTASAIATAEKIVASKQKTIARHIIRTP